MFKDLSPLITEAHSNREYRPVAVAIIKNAIEQILFVQSAKNSEWYLPQGGIEPEENILEALFRELEEELRMARADLRSVQCKGYKDLDFEPDRSDRRGFTKGKRYFFFDMEYLELPSLNINTAEVKDYKWADLKDAALVLAETRKEKRFLILKFLAD